MSHHDVHIHLSFSREHFRAGLSLLILTTCAVELNSEQVTLSTTYPSPSGVYVQIVTTGGSLAIPKDTFLARDAGRVGIGTSNPSAKLDVSGDARVGADLTVSGLTKLGAAASDPAGSDGALYYNTVSNRFRGHKGGVWADLAGSTDGWEIIRKANGANFATSIANCTAGKKIIGGGCGSYSGGGAAAGRLFRSMPLSTDNGWVCWFDGVNLPANTFEAMAICANVSP